MIDGFRRFRSSLTATISRTFVFRGRSRRQEILEYWFAFLLISFVCQLGAEVLLGEPSAAAVGEILGALFVVPFVALFVRRLHDQDRSGWWTLILLPLFAANLDKTIRREGWLVDAPWPALDGLFVPLIGFALLSMLFPLLPGTIGSNRFGPDPRFDDEPVGEPTATA
jgi:uncharacterized membrane protein YhaH (DUF805 family)